MLSVRSPSGCAKFGVGQGGAHVGGILGVLIG